MARRDAMNQLGNGLSNADHHEGALSVMEATLAMLRHLGASEHLVLVTQSNLATTYKELGRHEEAISMRRDVYSGFLKLHGEEHPRTLLAANNYASSHNDLQRFVEAKSLLRRTVPVARRALGENDKLTLTMTWLYARALYQADGATLDDLREAVETLEDVERLWKRVFGEAHPETPRVQGALANAREALAARAAASSSSGAA